MIDLERELRMTLEEDARTAPPPAEMAATLRRTRRRQIRVVATGVIVAVIIVVGATAGVASILRSSGPPVPVGPGPEPSPSAEPTQPIPYGLGTVDWPTDQGAIEGLLLQVPPALAKRGFDVEVLEGTFEGVPWPRKPGLVLCAPKLLSWGDSGAPGELPRVDIYAGFCRGAAAYFVSGPPGSGTDFRTGIMSPSPSPSPDPSAVLTVETGSLPPAPGEDHREYWLSWTEPHWGWTYRVEAESEDALAKAVEALVQVARVAPEDPVG